MDPLLPRSSRSRDANNSIGKLESKNFSRRNDTDGGSHGAMWGGTTSRMSTNPHDNPNKHEGSQADGN